MTWTREKHAEARVLSIADSGENPWDRNARLEIFLESSLDEIERLSTEIQRLWATEGITPRPDFPLALGLFEAKEHHE